MPGFWGPDPPGDLPEKSVLILYGMGGYPGPPPGGGTLFRDPPTLVRDPPYPGPGPPWGGTLGDPGGVPWGTLGGTPLPWSGTPPTLVRDPPTLPWVPPYPGPGPPYPTLGTPLPWVPPGGSWGYPPTLVWGTPLPMTLGGDLLEKRNPSGPCGGPGISLFGTHRVGVLKVGTFQDPRLEPCGIAAEASLHYRR